jgi:hypothetical protein
MRRFPPLARDQAANDRHHDGAHGYVTLAQITYANTCHCPG